MRTRLLLCLTAGILAACGTDAPVPTILTLDQTSLKLEEGGSGLLTAHVQDDTGADIPATDFTVAWTSSSSAIASVNANGAVTGVAAGTATISAKVGKASSAATVTVLPKLGVTSATLASGTRGLPYSMQLTATGGDGNYGWQVAQGALPPGLNLATTGLITGTPSTTGTFAFGAQATSAGANRTGSFSLTIVEPPVLQTAAVPTVIGSANSRWECHFVWLVGAVDGLPSVELFVTGSEVQFTRVSDGAISTLTNTAEMMKTFFGVDRYKKDDLGLSNYGAFWTGPFNLILRVKYAVGSPAGEQRTATTTLDCTKAYTASAPPTGADSASKLSPGWGAKP